MPRFPKPWYRKARGGWFVTIDGKQFSLGPVREQAFKRYHDLVGRPQKKKVASDSILAVTVQSDAAKLLRQDSWFYVERDNLIQGKRCISVLRSLAQSTSPPLESGEVLTGHSESETRFEQARRLAIRKAEQAKRFAAEKTEQARDALRDLVV